MPSSPGCASNHRPDTDEPWNRQDHNMNPLDQKVTDWRSQLAKTLPLPDETVRELEDHLREQIAELMREGLPLDAAFDVGLLRLGEAKELAGEFYRAQPGWFGIGWIKDRASLLLFGVVVAGCAWTFWHYAGILLGRDAWSLLLLFYIFMLWSDNRQLRRRIEILTRETIQKSTARQEKRSRLGFLRLLNERAEHGAKLVK